MKLTTTALQDKNFIQQFITDSTITTNPILSLGKINTLVFENKFNHITYLFLKLNDEVHGLPITYQNTVDPDNMQALRVYVELSDDDRVLLGTNFGLLPFENFRMNVELMLESQAYTAHDMFRVIDAATFNYSDYLVEFQADGVEVIKTREVNPLYYIILHTKEASYKIPLTNKEGSYVAFYNFNIGASFEINIPDLHTISEELKKQLEQQVSAITSYCDSLAEELFIHTDSQESQVEGNTKLPTLDLKNILKNPLGST